MTHFIVGVVCLCIGYGLAALMHTAPKEDDRTLDEILWEGEEDE